MGLKENESFCWAKPIGRVFFFSFLNSICFWESTSGERGTEDQRI